MRAVRRMGMAAISVVAVALVAWPAVAPEPADGFPVSNYPMFARPRDRVSSFPFVVLRDPSGDTRLLDVGEISGTDQPMQAAMTISQAIRTGTADELCREIAAQLPELGELEIVTAAYDAVAWFEGVREPVRREVHATCPSETPG